MYLKQLIVQFEKKEQILNLNLADEIHLSVIQKLVDKLFNETNYIEEINELEKEMIKEKNNHSLLAHTAVKIAKSKQILSEITEPLHFSIVIAIFKENIRLLTKDEHEFGENILINKIKQIEELTTGFPNITWDMILVDDGCPNNSGKLAEKILKEQYKGDNIQVLFLKNAINEKHPAVKGMLSTDDSKKGGSIEYGMWEASDKNFKNHCIIYTDIDSSTHLGQIGLLIDPIYNGKKLAAIASRREHESIVIKTEHRNLREKLFIYFWKRMLKRLNYIVDTQCSFKAFNADIVKKIVLNTIEKRFAFDIELLLRTDILSRHSIEKVPASWTNRDDPSTKEETQPYLDMLKVISKMYHKYLPANAESHKFAYLVDSLNEQQWNTLIAHIPEGIQIKSPVHYDIYSETTAADFNEILEKYSD